MLAAKVKVEPGQLLIDGQWVDGGKTFDTINPATGEVLTQIAEASSVEVDRAVDAARRAFEYSFYPDTISTDLHRFSVERYAIDMPATMSKFLHLGMPLPDVILKSTWAPAQAIGRPELGTLRPGTRADILVFDIESGEFDLEDTHQQIEKAQRRITPVLVVKNGEVFEPGDHASRLRDLYQCDRDVFLSVERSK